VVVVDNQGCRNLFLLVVLLLEAADFPFFLKKHSNVLPLKVREFI